MFNKSGHQRQHKDFTHFIVLIFTKTSCRATLNQDVLAQSYRASVNLHHQSSTTAMAT